MNDKIKRIQEIASANGVSLHKNFTTNYLSTHGFYEGPQALAESTVDEMERLCFLGVNGGFDGSLKSAIEKLSGVVIGLTEVKNGDLRAQSKLDVQRGKVLNGVNKSAYALRLDARDPIREYIASSVDAVETIISLHGEGEIFSLVDKRQIELMQESKQKLGELAVALNSIMDAGSSAAGKYANDILKLLGDWRKDCSRFMCTSGSIKYLDEALSVAKNWNKLSVAPNKKDKIKELPKLKRDELSIIASSRSGLETLSVFNARIQTRLAEIDKMRDEATANRQKSNELKAELTALTNNKKEVALEFKNTGDAVKANNAMAEIRRRSEELEAEIKSVEGNGRLAKKEHDVKVKREIAMNVKYICDMLTDNKSDLVFLTMVIKHVDFNALVGFMTGRSADTEEARESIFQIRARVEKLRQDYVANAETLREEEEVNDEILNDETLFEKEEEIVLDENGLDPELAALLKDFNDEKEEEKTENKEESIRRIVPLGDDDK